MASCVTFCCMRQVKSLTIRMKPGSIGRGGGAQSPFFSYSPGKVGSIQAETLPILE